MKYEINTGRSKKTRNDDITFTGAKYRVMDGSYSLSIKDGELVHQYIACPSLPEGNKTWRILAEGCELPGDQTAMHDGWENNDTIIVNVLDSNDIAFVKKEFLQLIN